MDANYEQYLKIEVAAQDSDLMAFYELAIKGDTEAVNEARAELIELMNDDEVLQLRNDIMRTYDLSEADLTRTIGSWWLISPAFKKAKTFLLKDS
jgi:hypothetical protein